MAVFTTLAPEFPEDTAAAVEQADALLAHEHKRQARRGLVAPSDPVDGLLVVAEQVRALRLVVEKLTPDTPAQAPEEKSVQEPAAGPRVVAFDLPEEPPTGSVVLDRSGVSWQRAEGGPRRTDDTIAHWAAPNTDYSLHGVNASWLDLCHRAPLTVVHEPTPEVTG